MPRRLQPAHRIARAFTLIELMISIVFVLILMLGINKVFQMCGTIVSEGTALTQINSTARGAQATIDDDFRNAAGTDQPFMWIASNQQTAFMDEADMHSDPFFKMGQGGVNGASPSQEVPALEVDPTNSGTPTQLPRALYGLRSHRIDTMGFFATSKYNSQTALAATNAPFISRVSSREAYIWYGHLQVADNLNGYGLYQQQYPGAGSPANENSGADDQNPNNFYARDWTLGRVAILLNGTVPVDGSTNLPAAEYFQGTLFTFPFCWSQSNSSYRSNAQDGSQIYTSRYDLALTTITQQRTLAKTWFTNNNEGTGWQPSLNWARYQAAPFFIKPISASAMATTSPIFLRHCSSFIVEFAGDFVKQNPDGTLISTPSTSWPQSIWEGQDGVTDFYIDPVTKEKRIRWYGLPRDVNGDGQILGETTVPCPTLYATTAKYDPNQLVDVVPVRDILETATGVYNSNAEPNTELFESAWPANAVDYGNPITGLQKEAQYYVGWTATQTKPSMIRFLITIESPTSSTASKTFEYVMNMQ